MTRKSPPRQVAAQPPNMQLSQDAAQLSALAEQNQQSAAHLSNVAAKAFLAADQNQQSATQVSGILKATTALNRRLITEVFNIRRQLWQHRRVLMALPSLETESDKENWKAMLRLSLARVGSTAMWKAIFRSPRMRRNIRFGPGIDKTLSRS